MIPVFLHGGGDDPGQRAASLGPFLEAARSQASGPIALVVVEATEAEAWESFRAYSAIFESLTSAESLAPILITPVRPLKRAVLEALRPSGVFVCGGVTPLYHQALCLDQDWLAYLHTRDLPYGGTSAGAAIAAHHAILGGWQMQRDHVLRPILFQGASEGLEQLTVEAGLGLVPFAVEVHASQLGTLTRLIQAVDVGLVSEGWAIDENTLLQVVGSDFKVYGQGHAYHLRRLEGGASSIAVHTQAAR